MAKPPFILEGELKLGDVVELEDGKIYQVIEETEEGIVLEEVADEEEATKPFTLFQGSKKDV